MTKRLEIGGLTKYYGDNLVLDRIDLDVDIHEVVGLIGASGSGKSTLLRCINRLVEYDAGTIKLDGVDIESEEMSRIELRKRTGIVFQAYNLFPHMNVLDNITLAPRKVHEVDRAEAETRAMELLGLFDRVRRLRIGSPVASSSGSPSCAPWPPTPTCCCSTR